MPGSLDLLSVVVFLPALGAFFLVLLPPDEKRNLKAAALGITLITFVISLLLWSGFDAAKSGYQFEKSVGWVESFGIRYHVGIDGISLFLILLTTFLVPIAVLSAWGAIESRVREFVISLCLLETGMLGAFAALDLFLFYVFWEAMLVPMYFLIGIWGGQRRVYAAVKFFIFTMAGSLLMLIAILSVAAQPDGTWSFDLPAALARSFDPSTEVWLFSAFALAFAIKVPMFPVHTWLPDAHVEAPTAGSVILAGVLLKLGVYGFLRFAFPLFPHAAFALLPVIGWLAVISILYGALVAWMQADMKKLVAYSSVSHLGFCMLGISAMTVEAVTGSIYQCLAHGMSTGALFLLVGMLYERRHTRVLAEFGGIARRVPVFAFFFVFVSLASAGLPALGGFPGEFLILLGTFTAGKHAMFWAALAAIGVILSAVYLLLLVQKVLFGPLQNPANENLRDMNSREIAVLLPVAAMSLLLGVAPKVFLDPIEPAARAFVGMVHQRAGVAYLPDVGAKRLTTLAPIRPANPAHFPMLRAAPLSPRIQLLPSPTLDRPVDR